MKTCSNMGSWALSAALALGCSQQAVRQPSALDQPHANRQYLPASATAGTEERLTPASFTVSVPEQLVRSHCMREQQCGNIGPSNTYSSGTDCLSRVQTDWAAELSARTCPQGTNDHGLRRCLSFLRVQDCLDRYTQQTLENQCRPEQICGQ